MTEYSIYCTAKISGGATQRIPVITATTITATAVIAVTTADCFCLQCFDAVGWAAGRASGM